MGILLELLINAFTAAVDRSFFRAVRNKKRT